MNQIQEKMFQFVAETIDADYQPCDDGFVICTRKTLKNKDEKELVGGVDFIFDEEGNFEGMKICK